MFLDAKYQPAIDLILKAVAQRSPEIQRSYENVPDIAQSMQQVFAQLGHKLSLGQAEEVYALYSQNSWATWLIGENSVARMQGCLSDFCHDVLFGENHLGLSRSED